MDQLHAKKMNKIGSIAPEIWPCKENVRNPAPLVRATRQKLKFQSLVNSVIKQTLPSRRCLLPNFKHIAKKKA